MSASDERRLQALVLAPVRRVRRRLNAGRALEAAVLPAWAGATAALLARLLLREHAVWAAPLVLGGALAWAAVRARARAVSLAHAAVLADRSAGAGGLLLTRLEVPVGAWELAANQAARGVRLPPLAWRRPALGLGAAALFLAAGLLVPLPQARRAPPNAAAAAKVDAVQAEAEALARETPLGGALEEELARLRQEVEAGRFDAEDWEAADGLQEALAQRAAEAAVRLGEAEAAARELEDALGAAGGAEGAAREREALERALLALGEGGTQVGEAGGGAQAEGDSVQGGAQQGEGAQQGDGDSAQGEGVQQGEGTGAQAATGADGGAAQAAASAGGDGGARQAAAGRADGGASPRGAGGAPRSPTDVARLREALQRRREALARRFGEGQGREGQARQGEGRGSGRGRGEGQGAGEGEGEGPPGHASRGVRPGRGEAGRGGGAQPLVFGEAAQMDPERLAYEPLPPGQGGEAGEVWGLRAAEPPRPGEGTGRAPAAGGGALQGEAATGPAAGPLLPRNRDLVRRYFGGP